MKKLLILMLVFQAVMGFSQSYKEFLGPTRTYSGIYKNSYINPVTHDSLNIDIKLGNATFESTKLNSSIIYKISGVQRWRMLSGDLIGATGSSVFTDNLYVNSLTHTSDTAIAVFNLITGKLSWIGKSTLVSSDGGGTTDTTHLSDRIDLKLNKVDTVHLSDRIDLKLNKVDTVHLSDRIDLKLNKVDTVHLSDRIDLKLNKVDTVHLSDRIDLKLNKVDTVHLSDRIDLKLNKIDTVHLSDRIDLKLNKVDTVHLSDRIDLKLNKVDTVNLVGDLYLLNNYYNKTHEDTANLGLLNRTNTWTKNNYFTKSNTDSSSVYFQNSNSGTGKTNGLQIGIDGNSNAFINQRENQPLKLVTPNRIDLSATNLLTSNSGTALILVANTSNASSNILDLRNSNSFTKFKVLDNGRTYISGGNDANLSSLSVRGFDLGAGLHMGICVENLSGANPLYLLHKDDGVSYTPMLYAAISDLYISASGGGGGGVKNTFIGYDLHQNLSGKMGLRTKTITSGYDIDINGVTIFQNATTFKSTVTIDSLTTRQESSIIASAGSIVLPSGASGFGEVYIFNSGTYAEFANFYFSSDGTVVLQNNSANVNTADSGTNLSIFESGTTVTIKNNLGGTRTIKMKVNYSTN